MLVKTEFWDNKVMEWRIGNFTVRYSYLNGDYLDCSFSENKTLHDPLHKVDFVQPFYVNLATDKRFGLDFSKPQNDIQKKESEHYKEAKDKFGMGGLVVSWRIHKSTLVKVLKQMRNHGSKRTG